MTISTLFSLIRKNQCSCTNSDRFPWFQTPKMITEKRFCTFSDTVHRSLVRLRSNIWCLHRKMLWGSTKCDEDSEWKTSQAEKKEWGLRKQRMKKVSLEHRALCRRGNAAHADLLNSFTAVNTSLFAPMTYYAFVPYWNFTLRWRWTQKQRKVSGR